MSRPFGKVTSSLWGSSKFRALASSKSRLAYIYLLTNDHGNSIGAYRLPLPYISADLEGDLDGKPETAKSVIADLQRVGLIEYDEAEKVVMIHAWFDHNPITNANHMAGAARAFSQLPSRTSFRARLAVDLMLSGYQSARSLEALGREKLASSSVKAQSFGQKNLESATKIIEEMLAIKDAISGSEKDLLDAISALPERLSIGLSEALSIALPIHRDRDTDRERDTDTDRDKGLSIAQTPISDEIAALQKKAAEAEI